MAEILRRCGKLLSTEKLSDGSASRMANQCTETCESESRNESLQLNFPPGEAAVGYHPNADKKSGRKLNLPPRTGGHPERIEAEAETKVGHRWRLHITDPAKEVGTTERTDDYENKAQPETGLHTHAKGEFLRVAEIVIQSTWNCNAGFAALENVMGESGQAASVVPRVRPSVHP